MTLNTDSIKSIACSELVEPQGLLDPELTIYLNPRDGKRQLPIVICFDSMDDALRCYTRLSSALSTESSYVNI